ncbi:MAG: Holliday junction resolvase RuvX [Clostridiales bacterium]|nr:Holliday junction resolvase RuvX [Clostridiales bacterium]MCF8021121.1 Holliday junction resolvase RuvX [Clostridiales bacterium]
MGLDIGNKTIGVAVSDLMGLTAQGVEVIRRSGSIEEEMYSLQNLINEKEVNRIVVGLPINMNGTIGPQCEKVLEYKEKLETVLQLPVETWDERLTTVEAERLLINADMSRKKRKSVIDKMAAVIILQGFLDSKNN